MKQIVAALAVYSACALPIQAASCGQRDAIVAELQGKHGETLQMEALARSDRGAAVFEIWANVETGTWTATATGANGLTCIAGFGDNYRRVAAQAPGIDG